MDNFFGPVGVGELAMLWDFVYVHGGSFKVNILIIEMHIQCHKLCIWNKVRTIANHCVGQKWGEL